LYGRPPPHGHRTAAGITLRQGNGICIDSTMEFNLQPCVQSSLSICHELSHHVTQLQGY